MPFAVAAWLLVAAIADHRFAAVITASAYGIACDLADPITLAWMMAGGAVCALLTLASFTPLRRTARKS